MRFADAVRKKKLSGQVPVIPDIKCVSPKEGDLLRGRDPVEVAGLLASLGAPAISVVTEPKEFGGSLALLEKVSQRTGLPILRKDFVTTTDDLKQSLEYGASAILLMCAVQPEPLLSVLYEEALRLGLEPLVETHTEEEMLLARKLGAKLIGINNKNILELERDDGTVALTSVLAGSAPSDAVLISESSIASVADVRAAIEAGADAVLVGTAIWQADCMEEFYMQCERMFS